MSSITLTQSQQRVFNALKAFLKGDDRIFVLSGYAGTGKTTLMRFLVEHLVAVKRNFVLLASTGRAASVLSHCVGAAVPASTIHSHIYTFNGFNQSVDDIVETKEEFSGQLFLDFKPAVRDSDGTSVVYLVDEASMIGDEPSADVVQARFGSGKLLTELLDYDKSPKSKFVFVGDPCQLPPVSQVFSPALSVDYLRSTFHCGVAEGVLTEIMRQDDGNDIVSTSKRIRQLALSAPVDESCYFSKVWGKLPIFSGRDIHFYPSHDAMLSRYLDDVRQHGFNQSIFVSYSNSRSYKTSQWLRSQLGYGGNIDKGELLQVIQNNLLANFVNGDFVVVDDVSSHVEMRAGLSFRKATVHLVSGGDSYTMLLMEDTLHNGRLNISKQQQTDLFVDFVIRMKQQGITQKKQPEAFDDMLRYDPYLNALRCVFGYCVTCHKAQGGEWRDVYVEMPRNITLNPTKSKYQWVYTAITRSSCRLHLVNDFFYGNSH